MSDDPATIRQKAALLGVEPYPNGMGWSCGNGHEYPESYGPDRCEVDDLPLTRILFALPVGPRS